MKKVKQLIPKGTKCLQRELFSFSLSELSLDSSPYILFSRQQPRDFADHCNRCAFRKIMFTHYVDSKSLSLFHQYWQYGNILGLGGMPGVCPDRRHAQGVRGKMVYGERTEEEPGAGTHTYVKCYIQYTVLVLHQSVENNK